MVKAARAPLGPLPAERILRDHLGTIEDWRCCGASWDQIAALLSEAGWRSRRGTVVRADQLRAMVSRIRKGLQRPAVEPTARVAPPTSNSASGIGARVGLYESFPPVPSLEGGEVAARIRRAAALRLEGEQS